MPVEHVFNELEIAAEPFALCELRGRCDLGLGREPAATLHYILAGEGEIVVPGGAAIPVARASMVLVPALRPHLLRSFGTGGDPVPDCRRAGAGLVRHLAGGGVDEGLLALCSRVTVGLRGVRGLIDLIREPVSERIAPGAALEAPVAALLGEVSVPRTGSRAMIRALLLQCVIHLLRERWAARDVAVGWMEGLEDEGLWTALRAMLDAPGEPHSVASLAGAAGMSRSVFARRFAEAYGNGPMALLRDLRMRHAATLMRRSDLPVKRIAELTGFRSRSAFTRSFTAAIGASPRRFRREGC